MCGSDGHATEERCALVLETPHLVESWVSIHLPGCAAVSDGPTHGHCYDGTYKCPLLHLHGMTTEGNLRHKCVTGWMGDGGGLACPLHL
jgi:hypothetical protein